MDEVSGKPVPLEDQKQWWNTTGPTWAKSNLMIIYPFNLFGVHVAYKCERHAISSEMAT